MGGVQRDNELHPLPLPMGEVAERSEDGEGIPGCKTLSVTSVTAPPKGEPSVSKKPRRVCRPQAANKVRSFSAGACTWQKIPYRLQVCELSAKGGQEVRAADCNPLVKKGQRPFLTD